MSLFHAVFPKRNHQGQIRFEFLHLGFDFFTDIDNLSHSFLFEIFIGSDNVSETFLNKFLSRVSINSLKLIIHPRINVRIPPVHNRPKCIIRSEFLVNLLQSRIVGLLNAK